MIEQGSIRVLLADDHTMFRQGLREVLSTDPAITVTGEAENGEEAVVLAERLKPNVVLLDVEMPVMGAEEAMEPLLRLSPRPKIVVVTMHDDSRLVRRLMGMGADAYLVKSASMQELISAVRAAAEPPEEEEAEERSREKDQWDRNVVMVLPERQLERPERGTDDLISGRELEVLLFIARGLSNRQVANALHLSVATVKRHLANIYAKIGVQSRGEATRKALYEGWISARDVTRTNDE